MSANHDWLDTPGVPQLLKFPEGFLWGVSTSSYQVEGNNFNNQWAAWEAAGRIKSGHQCGLACDWWRNAERDFDIAQQLNLNALRLSVEWSRIESERGVWEQQAFRRYREMLEGLRARGIRPFICLHHFTNPLWFEREGAFLGPNALQYFEAFTERVVGELGDLCQDWITFNEPNVYASLGHQIGEFPPGRSGQIWETMRVLTRMCRAHARAYHTIHRLQPAANVGWAQHLITCVPDDPGSSLDRMLCRMHDATFNGSFLEMIRNGQAPFPFSLVREDLSEARDATDYLGVNVYSRVRLSFDFTRPAQLFGYFDVPEDVPQGDRGVAYPFGEAYPQGLLDALERFKQFGKPVYVLENGVPDREDRLRPWVIAEAVRMAHELIRRGIDLRGYFHWTLTDNFEWNEGWYLRFGLVALDPETQERTMRPSGRMFGEIARLNGITPELAAEFVRPPVTCVVEVE